MNKNKFAINIFNSTVPSILSTLGFKSISKSNFELPSFVFSHDDSGIEEQSDSYYRVTLMATDSTDNPLILVSNQFGELKLLGQFWAVPAELKFDHKDIARYYLRHLYSIFREADLLHSDMFDGSSEGSYTHVRFKEDPSYVGRLLGPEKTYRGRRMLRAEFEDGIRFVRADKVELFDGTDYETNKVSDVVKKLRKNWDDSINEGFNDFKDVDFENVRKQIIIALDELGIRFIEEDGTITDCHCHSIRIGKRFNHNEDGVYYILIDDDDHKVKLVRNWADKGLEVIESFEYSVSPKEDKPFYYHPSKMAATYNNINIYEMLKHAQRLFETDPPIRAIV